MPTETLEGFPLTEQQMRARRLGAERGVPCASAEIRIEGKLDEQRLREAVEKLVARHEILRTTYIEAPKTGGTLQVIKESIDPWMHQLDEENFAPGHFVCSIRSSESGGAVLKLRAPSLSLDRTGLMQFFEQLAAAYAGEDSEDDVFQYADYGQWQCDIQEDEGSRESARFWTQALSGGEPEFRLPLEKAAAPSSFSLRAIQFEIGEEQKSRLEKLAREWGSELKEILFAVWGSLLARATGRPAISIGALEQGRTHSELKQALGLFDRYLPLEFKWDEALSTRTAVAQMRKKVEANRKHADAFQWRRGAVEVFQPMLFGWHGQVPELSSGGARFRLQKVQCSLEPYKVKLEFEERLEHIAGLISFDASRVSLTGANCLLERFQTLLQQVLNSPDTPLAKLHPVGRQEEKILRNFAWGTAPLEVRPVLECFREAVARRAGEPAVVCRERVLTYGELNERANQLANHLLELGVSQGKAVGLSCERSVELVVGIVGILKAGGAYVPLDPAYPKDRLEFMIDDAGIEILVLQPQLRDKLPLRNVKTVLLSEGNEQLQGASSKDPEQRPSMDQLAYVIYTSGSTGQPKGVMIRHENLAISTAARLEYYAEPVRNYLLLSSFAFDSSIAGIFWTLGSGGTLTLPAEGLHQEPQEILRLIQAGGVTHLLALPSFYRAIVESGSGEALGSLGTVIVAGEACPRELVQMHYQKVGGATLFNEYGPTEGTVWSTVHRCTAEEQGQTVPIGRPVPGMGVYILDGSTRLAGLGVPGEIHISGPALAPGYLNRPELTAQKFVASPFENGQRLYRTGDLGRFLENGSIEFLGRTDHQVKIRGYRVEIGEIEQAIRTHEGVAEAVVIAREDTPGDQRLVGYIVPRHPSDSLAAELKSVLEKKLPLFMVPSLFVMLDRMPLTPNGKLDRKALPAPSQARAPGKDNPPKGAEEEFLAKIWTDLLKVQGVGRGDNFFELGGHSLLALQLLARIRDGVKVDLPLRTIFDHPTVERLATVLKQRKGASGSGVDQIKKIQRRAASRAQLAAWEEKDSEGEEHKKLIQNEGKGN